MTGTLKAIETHYNGYRFRSRTEARWAVFFDSLGIAYEFEREGFDLGDGLFYLPDFWLPAQKLWVEVKPVYPEDDAPKLHRLAQASGHDLVCVIGAPHPCAFRFGEQYADGNHAEDRHYLFMADEGWDNLQAWCECPYCGLIGVKYQGRAARLECGCIQSHLPPGEYEDRAHAYDTPRLLKAYDTARSARFEFNR